MSISTKQNIRTDHVANDWKPRPELREAMQRIATIAVDDHTAVIGEKEMTFQNGAERTTISASPINVDTCDGHRIAEIITIRTPLTSFKLFDEKRYAFINIFATTGAVVRDADGKDAILSRLPLFEDDTDALTDLNTPLIANGARLHLVGPICGLYQFEGRKEEYTSADVMLPSWDERSFWSAEDFENAREKLSHHGVFGTVGPRALTAELPWDADATSAMFGERTSLLEIRADVPHPAAGNGLFFRLNLPLNFSDEEAQSWAAWLNRSEAEAIDTPPFFGAWCSFPKSGTLSFGGFWPNLLYRPGTVSTIAFWCAARNRFARQLIEGSADRTH